MRVTSKYSTIICASIDEWQNAHRQGCITLQSESVEIQGIYYFYVEIVEKENIPLYRGEITPVSTPTPFDEPVKSKEEQDLETALATELKNDPQGKYNGCLLEVPFNNQDWEWVDWTLKNMKNKFIRDRVQLIAKAGYAGYGK